MTKIPHTDYYHRLINQSSKRNTKETSNISMNRVKEQHKNSLVEQNNEARNSTKGVDTRN